MLYLKKPSNIGLPSLRRLEVKTMKHLKNTDHISNHYIFFLTLVQVVLLPYCCLFSKLSNNMSDFSLGTFS